MQYTVAIFNSLNSLNRKIDIMALNTTRLITDVAAQKTVIESGVKLLTDVATSLRDVQIKLADALAANDPAAIEAAQVELDAIATDVEGNTSALATAIAANTVAAPVA